MYLYDAQRLLELPAAAARLNGAVVAHQVRPGKLSLCRHGEKRWSSRMLIGGCCPLHRATVCTVDWLSYQTGNRQSKMTSAAELEGASHGKLCAKQCRHALLLGWLGGPHPGDMFRRLVK